MLDIIWSVFLTAAASVDIRKKKIPDSFVICGLVLGIVRVLVREHHTFADGIAGAAVGAGVFFVILFLAPGSFGGGDVKLSVAAGLYLGAVPWIKSFVIAVMTAGVYALYLVIRDGRERKTEIAFGPFLCLGAVIMTWYR